MDDDEIGIDRMRLPDVERPVRGRNCRCSLTPLGMDGELAGELARCVARPVTPEIAGMVLPVLANYLAATRGEHSAH